MFSNAKLIRFAGVFYNIKYLKQYKNHNKLNISKMKSNKIENDEFYEYNEGAATHEIILIDASARQMFLKLSEIKKFENDDITVLGEKIHVGCRSDLHGFYTKPLEYVGRYEHYSVFYLGSERDIFGSWYYYDLLHIVDDNMISLYLMPKCASQLIYNESKKEWI